MIALVLRRIGWAIVVGWFVVTATFAMTTAIPADPMKAMLGPHATPENIARAREHYCLDRGVIAQYGCFVGNVLHGDLGESYRTKRAVTAILGERVWPTAQLALAAILLQLLIGVPLGVIAAVRRGRWPDHAANLVGLVGQSAPTFFVGTLLLYVFAYRFGWFPITGYGEPGLDRLHHLVLPAASLATVGVAYYARVVRSELVDVLGADYVRTARAKGLAEPVVVVRHALRNALGPLVTLVGLDLGLLLAGAFVTEYIFAWPGLGREAVQAILAIDTPVIVGVVMIGALAIAAASLAVDLVYLWLDPRLRDR
jgi:peptide/nickel transport system permease protein